MNYNYVNYKPKFFYNSLVELSHNCYTVPGLLDTLFLDLCRTKIDTNIYGTKVNISIIIPDKEEQK